VTDAPPGPPGGASRSLPQPARPAYPLRMEALAITPGVPWSLHRRSVPAPRLDAVPGGRGVRVRVLQAGLCGTDAEVASGLFGYGPPGSDHLVLGHEHLGEIVEVGPGVEEPWLRPGHLVVASNRRPGRSPWDRVGLQDFTADTDTIERGIRGLHGFLAEEYVDDPAFLTPVPDLLAGTGVLTEPMSVIEKGLAQVDAVQRRLRIWEPARALVIGAGTIGLLAVLALRLRGLAVTCWSRRSLPYRNADLVARAGARYVPAGEADIAAAAAAHGPFDIVVEASGAAELVAPAALALAPNGILLLTSVTAGRTVVPVDLAAWNQAFVLWNRAMVGTVNASRAEFALAVGTLTRAEAELPGWCAGLITHRIAGLDAAAVQARLRERGDAIKVVVEIGTRG